jgi:NAD+ kinase
VNIGVLPHERKAEARELAPKVVRWIEDRGHTAVVRPPGASGLDLLVVLGGDGTMLHGVELCGFAGVPILGVNLGLLGFLTEVGADGVYDALDRFLAGGHRLDERTTVEAEVARASGTPQRLGEAINEVSVERAVGGKMIRMVLTIGGQTFTSIGADGLIVATPTGSTAYAFSMRGPIVSPDLRSLVVVAAGAHSLFDRPLVVAEGSDVEVAVRFGGRGIVVMDGRPRTEITEGDVLCARVGASTVRLVRLGPASHFTRVAQKFGLQ